MMIESRKQVWAALRRQQRREKPEIASRTGGGSATGLEAWVGRLEVGVEKLKVDLARVSERLNHVPTRIEVRSDIETAVDRAASRTQRTVAIVGGLVTAALTATNYLPKLLH